MEISAQQVKKLREKTGAGVMDCKRALSEKKGDVEKALTYLREKGLASAQKKVGRQTSEGVISPYIHAGSKLGALVELNCETDFVAKTDDFQAVAKDIAMHVAAANPEYVKREDVPADILEKEREIFRAQAKNSGKPDKIIEKIVEGRIEKYLKEVCLLEQVFVKNPDMTIQDLITEAIAKLGENMKVSRFVRLKIGEGTPQAAE